jgi:hypothetical protein
MAAPRATPATKEEIAAAARLYEECQVDKALSLDDGISDARTVGEVIANSCRPQMESFASLMTKDQKRDRVRLMLIERMASRAVQSATETVLFVRQRKSQSNVASE